MTTQPLRDGQEMSATAIRHDRRRPPGRAYRLYDDVNFVRFCGLVPRPSMQSASSPNRPFRRLILYKRVRYVILNATVTYRGQNRNPLENLDTNDFYAHTDDASGPSPVFPPSGVVMPMPATLLWEYAAEL